MMELFDYIGEEKKYSHFSNFEKLRHKYSCSVYFATLKKALCIQIIFTNESILPIISLFARIFVSFHIPPMYSFQNVWRPI